ncbi:MAG: hypothetical protein M3115_06440 [Thermoproteota archaeon]|nr:hypothetical protein [Thermoproteota archaeon]
MISSSSSSPNTLSWIRIGLLALPISGLLTMWSTLIPQPNPGTEFEAWSRFVTTTEYFVSHLLGTNLGIILLIFGVIALGAYLAKDGGRSGRFGLVAMVIIITANTLALMSAGGWSTFTAPAIGRAYLAGIEEAMLIDVGLDYIVIFMLVIVLAFIGNVFLGVAIWRSRILPKGAGAIWIAWAVMFYVAGVLSGFLVTSSSLPTQPVGSLLMAISGGWIVWGVFRQPSPAALQQQEA